METIFTKIIKGEISCAKIYEDEHVFAFLDINPINPGHTLVIPKNPYENIFEIPDEVLEKILKPIAKKIEEIIKQNIKNNPQSWDKEMKFVLSGGDYSHLGDRPTSEALREGINKNIVI